MAESTECQQVSPCRFPHWLISAFHRQATHARLMELPVNTSGRFTRKPFRSKNNYSRLQVWRRAERRHFSHTTTFPPLQNSSLDWVSEAVRWHSVNPAAHGGLLVHAENTQCGYFYPLTDSLLLGRRCLSFWCFGGESCPHKQLRYCLKTVFLSIKYPFVVFKYSVGLITWRRIKAGQTPPAAGRGCKSEDKVSHSHRHTPLEERGPFWFF